MRVEDLRAHEDVLGFRPEDSVRWLSPGELWRTAIKVVLSSVFASYADKREVQEALQATPLAVRSPSGELWLDFVADLGDGFDATRTVAGLLAAEQLVPEPAPGGEPVGPLPRASVLVLGGDEVYPTASAREYDNRMKGPYRSALPDAAPAPSMFVLPGNHDWYDGLTSFLRMFAQGRSIGGWRTRQTRSYFAVQLPNRWWLVGLDTQFGSELDAPQLRYFARYLTAELQPGDSVILCCATPTWVETADEKHRDAFNSLHWFDRNYIRTRHDGEGLIEQTGASVRLWITGDSHHYARFAERWPDEDATPANAAQETGTEPVLPPDAQRRQMVTCGLGGAYLSATHDLPDLLPLPPARSRVLQKGEESTRFARADVCYPDRDTSARWSRRLAAPWSRFWLPRRNPGFGMMAAGVHVVALLALSSMLGLVVDLTPVAAVRTATVGPTVVLGLRVTIIATAVLLLPWAIGLIRTRGRGPRKPSTAVAAVLLQLLVAEGALLGLVAADLSGLGSGWIVTVGAVWAAAVGWVFGSEAFALYVLLARHGQAFGWQMSGQAVEDCKGFVRMHLAPDGTLTLHPLVVDEVCHDWELADDPTVGIRPVPAAGLPVPRLLEAPVVIAPTPRPAVSAPIVAEPAGGQVGVVEQGSVEPVVVEPAPTEQAEVHPTGQK
jgi:Calcineurin-like phosphoesterase